MTFKTYLSVFGSDDKKHDLEKHYEGTGKNDTKIFKTISNWGFK